LQIRQERRIDLTKVLPRDETPEEPRPQTLLEKVVEDFYEGEIGKDQSAGLE